jgi:hypothetical protein
MIRSNSNGSEENTSGTGGVMVDLMKETGIGFRDAARLRACDIDRPMRQLIVRPTRAHARPARAVRLSEAMAGKLLSLVGTKGPGDLLFSKGGM